MNEKNATSIVLVLTASTIGAMLLLWSRESSYIEIVRERHRLLAEAREVHDLVLDLGAPQDHRILMEELRKMILQNQEMHAKQITVLNEDDGVNYEAEIRKYETKVEKLDQEIKDLIARMPLPTPSALAPANVPDAGTPLEGDEAKLISKKIEKKILQARLKRLLQKEAEASVQLTEPKP